MNLKAVPEKTYGVLLQNMADSLLEQAAENIILDAGYSIAEVHKLSHAFDHIRHSYIQTYSEERLKHIDELHTVRALLTHGDQAFIQLALNQNLLALLKTLIPGRFILNQQNGVINPPQQTYNQGAWHRDLPYQHFVSSKPLAINALFCLDEFTCGNGSTFVLPFSHKFEALPSKEYIQSNAIQIEAKAGSFIVLDAMLFHTGGFNQTNSVRRGVNHLYNIPYFKQQINLPQNLKEKLEPEAQEIFGFHYTEPGSVEAYLQDRAQKNDISYSREKHVRRTSVLKLAPSIVRPFDP